MSSPTALAAGGEEFLGDDFFQKLLGVVVDFFGLFSDFWVIENFRESPAQFPSVEEWRPVDEWDEVFESDVGVWDFSCLRPCDLLG